MSSSQGPRLLIILVTILGLAFAIYIGQMAGQGNVISIMIIFMFIFGTAILLWLGQNYWILIPMAFSLDIPGLPFMKGQNIGLTELVITGCFIIYVIRKAFKMDATRSGVSKYAMPVFAYFGWAAFIYALDPVGLNILGSSNIGGKFYLELIFALFAFLIMASAKVTDKTANITIWILIVGICIGKIYSINNYISDYAVEMDIDLEGAAYTWHQALVAPAALIMTYIFCRWRPSQILTLKRAYLWVIIAFCFFLAMQSGKRAGFAGVAMLPVLSGFLHRQYIFAFLYSVLAATLITVLVLGHSEVFELPLRAQRVLMNLPGNWDPSIQGVTAEGSMDSFRESLRELAIERIKENPIIGRGIGIRSDDIYGATPTDMTGTIIAMLAMGSSWHSTWFGIAADFGIPAALIWAIFWISVIVLSLKLRRLLPVQAPLWVLSMMIFFSFINRIMTSWTSGHSTSSPFKQWWLYGLLISIYATLYSRKSANANVTERNTLPVP